MSNDPRSADKPTKAQRAQLTYKQRCFDAGYAAASEQWRADLMEIASDPNLSVEALRAKLWTALATPPQPPAAERRELARLLEKYHPDVLCPYCQVPRVDCIDPQAHCTPMTNPRPARDPVVAKVVEKLYGDDESPPQPPAAGEGIRDRVRAIVGRMREEASLQQPPYAPSKTPAAYALERYADAVLAALEDR